MKFLRRILAFTLLLCSWFLIYVMVSATTDWGLAPWSTIFPIPDSVTAWERALNSFFDVGLGQYIFSIPAILIGAWVWWRARQQGRDLSLRIALGNVALYLALGTWLSLTVRLHRVLFPDAFGAGNYPEAIGYHLAVLPLIGFLLIFAGWVRWQQTVLRGERKAHAAAATQATLKHKRGHRLALPETDDEDDAQAETVWINGSGADRRHKLA